MDDPEGTFFYAAGTFAFIHSLWGVGLSHAYLNTVREKGRSICTRAHLGLDLAGKLITGGPLLARFLLVRISNYS